MSENEEQQLFFMRWAIQLGEKGRLSAPPNPWVGCVIVKDGEILGEGYHVEPGREHAEIVALRKAGKLAQGASAYVSLEPCAHHGRTPPCVQALIEAQVARVLIPLLDPDPNVAGKGVERLQKAGIEVIVGVAREEAMRSLAPYLHHRKTHLPYCVLKSALSIDGRTAAADGSSQWITDQEARNNAHLLRAQSQAILVGAETALKDNPRLTVRGIEGANQPIHVLLDSTGRVPESAALFREPTLVFATEPYKRKGAEVVVVEKLDLKEVLAELGRRGVIQLLIEGGSQVHTSFVKAGLVDRVVLYIGGCLLGTGGRPFLDLTIPTIEQASRWHLDAATRLGNDLRLDYLLSPE